MRALIGQVVYEETVHRARTQLAAFRSLPRARDLLQNPLHLCAGKIRVRHQARALTNGRFHPLAQKPLHQRRGAATLPNDRSAYGLARLPIPHERGFALIGDADGGDIPHVHPGSFHRRAQRLDLRMQNVHGIVLHPARARINLPEFTPLRRHDVPCFIKDNCAGTRRPLIQRNDILHCFPPF